TIILNLGVASFIITSIITSHLALLVNTYYSGKEINYGTREQFKDLMPSYTASFLMGFCVMLVGVIDIAPTINIMIQIIVGILFYIVVGKLFKLKAFIETINLLYSIIRKEN